jgi:hypothetical protein
MYSDNKKIRDVAEIAAKIMMGEKALHPNQQKLDVHEPEKDELTADDFKKLRAGKKVSEVKKEEVEQIEELKKSTLGSYVKKASKNLADRSFDHGEDEHRQYGMGDDAERDAEVERNEKKIATRQQGINRAATKLSKEEVEQIDEVSLKTATSAYVKRVGRDETGADPKAAKTISHIANRYGVKGVARAAKSADKEYGLNDPVHNKRKDFVKGVMADVKKEEVDQAAEFVLEYESKDGKFVHRAKPGVYGGTKDEKHAVDTLKGPKMKELSDIEAEKKKKKKMSEMVATYQEQGLKGLFASLVKEEPDNEQFTKEVEAQKEKNAGQGKKAEVAKAEVLAVQEEEFEVVMNEPNGYAEATIEERSMTEPEMKKKEQIVKSMKKGIAGFKERYGSRAKNVMYATATKRAMGEEVEQIQEEAPEGYQRRDGRLIPKIHSKMTPHEHGYDYTMQSIEDAPSKAKIHSQHKEILKDNPHPTGSKEHKDWEAGTNKAKADHLKDWS